MAMLKFELNRADAVTVHYALSLAYALIVKKLRHAQKQEKLGKNPRNRSSTLAMEAADYKTLLEKINAHLKATETKSPVKEGGNV